ncbi:MYND finger protein [Rutstroemia sp. NJR-2017a WRK4]|nr:MYND finger protein [Rutstroemia sp. NJR-2017a WRK4]
MLGPTRVKLSHFFYPIGNTPAVNLLETNPNWNTQDDAPTNVLMLGCGDLRNIFFSLWCNKDFSDSPLQLYSLTSKLQAPKLNCDFTCCDIEPAVLARNIFLFTLIIDNASNVSTWNLFYHLYVTDTDLELLKSQTEKLLEVSKSFDTWSSSSYGKTLHFLSVDTLEQIRNVWTQYYEKATLGAEGKKQWEAKYTRGIQAIFDQYLIQDKGGVMMHGVRSTGPHWISAVKVLSSCFQKYWKTGVVAGNSHDKEDLKRCTGGRANPLMAISSATYGEFAVHYGSDPLLGFHLAGAFDNESSDETYEVKVVELAKSQFREWCRVFRDQHRAETIKIRVFCGDALRFCYELQSLYRSSSIGWRNDILRLYTSPWYSKPLDLQKTHCPNRVGETQGFQIIDTSNLVDHLGLLNLLPATTPLLSQHTTSVLFTNCLLRASGKTSDTLSALLCSDVTTMSFLCGFAPTGHLLGYATEAYGMDAATQMTLDQSGGQTQCYLKVSWRCPTFGDLGREGHEPSMKTTRVVFQENQLVSYFFELYKAMFSYENLSSLMELMMRQSTSPSSTDFRHYNRMSFVGLLGLAKSRHVTADWDAFITSLVDMIECDMELLTGSNQLQELYVLLHLTGLFSNPILGARHPRKLPLIEAMFGPMRPPSAGINQGLLGQQNIPSVVWLCLKVPRKKLEVFTSQHKQRAGSGAPGLHINTTQLQLNLQNSYYSAQCFFGKLIQRAGDNYTCDVVEDKDGWNGTSDLIFTCAVPTWTLLLGPAHSIQVDLAISTSPIDVSVYTPRLGITMSVYGCGLDEKNVVVLKEPPGVQLAGSYSGPRSSPDNKNTCFVQLNQNSRIEAMEIRKPLGKLSLANASVVQVSACTLSLQNPNNENSNLLFRYPYPIDVRQAKISSTSKTVSVTVKASTARIPGGYDYNPFPVDVEKSYATSLTFPRFNLDQQPLIPTTKKLAWTETFMGFALSSQERMLYKTTFNSQAHTLPVSLQLKASLNIMIQNFSGMNHSHGRVEVFQLATTKTGIAEDDSNVDTIIFASALRHNPAQNSIVLDAYVVPLNDSRVHQIVPAFLKVMTTGKVLTIKVTPAEEVLWKQMLPAMAEACRTWQHTPSCQYMTSSTVPLSTSHGEIPICSCGEGKDVDNFPSFQGAEILTKFATRIAIMPLCAVPFVEEIIGDKEMEGLAATARESGVSRGVEMEQKQCNTCGKTEGSLKKCTRCGIVWYCNHGC